MDGLRHALLTLMDEAKNYSEVLGHVPLCQALISVLPNV